MVTGFDGGFGCVEGEWFHTGLNKLIPAASGS